jgi:FkbM family methyltransferase
MGTPRIRYNPPLTADLVARGAFAGEPFSVIDVGASGGIETHWQVFGDFLTAVGFDPLTAEVDRLAAGSPPGIRYEAARVTCRDRQTTRADQVYAQSVRYHDNQPFPRTSAARAIAIAKVDYPATVYDPSGQGTVTQRTITLDEFYEQHGRPNVDYLKIDTDGHDYYVLRGARRLFDGASVLGVCVECQFHGPVHHHANVFSNIDRFLRARGFSLFDIEVHRYSRGILPKPFMYALPAQTRGGQVLAGDALYARDAGDPEYEKKWGVTLPPLKLLKLACMFEIFGMEDCAAEVLVNHRKRLAASIEVERSLDLLTPSLNGQKLSFRQYSERFERRASDWFPSVRDRGYSRLLRALGVDRR